MSTVLHANCDAAAARVTRREAPVAHPNLVLATTILASSLGFVDGSVVNVGLPAIGHSLSADAPALQWVINAYLLPLSALLLLGGAAGDRVGRRRMLIAGVLLFALAFSASAMHQLLPGEATRWQRRNRRYLGVSFAVSHLIHLVALVALVRADSALFWTLTNPTNIVLAGTAYLFIAAMTATSFDRTAAWL